MVTATADRAASRSIDVDRLAVGLASASIALLCVARGWVLWSAPGSSGDINQWVTTSPFDWPLAVLVALQAASVLEDRAGARARVGGAPLPARLLALTLGWLVLCALVNPSWRAVDMAFHIAGAWAVVRTARRASGSAQTLLLGAVVLVGTAQAVLGIAQSRTGDALGLGVLELEGELYTFGSSAAGRGSLTHPYHLAALLVVAVAAAAVLATRLRSPARHGAIAALAVMGASLPLTFSRASALSVVPMLCLWLWRRPTRAVGAALAAGLVVGGLLGLNGISAKTARTVDVADTDSGRLELAEDALDLAADHPLFGVGPGRYVIELRDVEGHGKLLPPHNIVLHVAAEAGVVGGALTLATVLAFGWWLVRQPPMVLAAGLSLVPLHLLDAYPHAFPVGIFVSGFWVAVMAIASGPMTGRAATP